MNDLFDETSCYFLHQLDLEVVKFRENSASTWREKSFGGIFISFMNQIYAIFSPLEVFCLLEVIEIWKLSHFLKHISQDTHFEGNLMQNYMSSASKDKLAEAREALIMPFFGIQLFTGTI